MASRLRFASRRCAAVALTLLLPAAWGLPQSTGKVGSALLPHPAAEAAMGDPSANARGNETAFKPNYAASATMLRHWEKHVVQVRYVPSTEARFPPEEAKRLLNRSLDLWNRKIGTAVTLTLTDSSEAEVTVTLVKPGSLAGGAIGRTDVLFRLNDQVLTRATVRLNADLKAEEVVQVAAHELGHALGIQGHSSDSHDLMYPYAHMPAVITDRDLNTMSLSYAGAMNGVGASDSAAKTSAVLPAKDTDCL